MTTGACNPAVGFTWIGRTRFWSAPSSNNLNYSTEYPMTYEGDNFPDGLEDNKISRLNAHYKAVPEEFYSKSSRPVLRPHQNFQRWKKQRQRKANLWELCSGSGRLSWIAGLRLGSGESQRPAVRMGSGQQGAPEHDPGGAGHPGP